MMLLGGPTAPPFRRIPTHIHLVGSYPWAGSDVSNKTLVSWCGILKARLTPGAAELVPSVRPLVRLKCAIRLAPDATTSQYVDSPRHGATPQRMVCPRPVATCDSVPLNGLVLRRSMATSRPDDTTLPVVWVIGFALPVARACDVGVRCRW